MSPITQLARLVTEGGASRRLYGVVGSGAWCFRPMDLAQQILEVLIAHGRPMSIRLLAVTVQAPEASVRKMIEVLLDAHQVEVRDNRLCLPGADVTEADAECVILEALRLKGRPMSIPELAKATGLPATTANRCVRDLHRSRVLVQCFRGKFRLHRGT